MASDEGDTEFQVRFKVVVAELRERGFSQVDIARAAGVSKAMPTHWVKGGVASMKLEHAVGIWKTFGYSPMWLILGELPKMLPADSNVMGDWPFPDVDPELIGALPRAVRLQLQGALFAVASVLDVVIRKPGKTGEIDP